MLAEGLTMRLQILYLISAFRVLPEPGFTVMDAVLLFASVSSAWSATYSQVLILNYVGLIPDAHSHPRLHAKEPS
jgi:hypothetical protein